MRSDPKGSLELYPHPHNKFVAGFIGSPKMKFLPCTVDGRALRLPNGATFSVEPNGGPKPAELGIRPEHLRPDGTGDSTLEGEVITIERLGAESYMYVDIGQEEPLVVKAEAAVPVKHGERARIGIPRRRRTCLRRTGAASSGIRFTKGRPGGLNTARMLVGIRAIGCKNVPLLFLQ